MCPLFCPLLGLISNLLPVILNDIFYAIFSLPYDRVQLAGFPIIPPYFPRLTIFPVIINLPSQLSSLYRSCNQGTSRFLLQGGGGGIFKPRGDILFFQVSHVFRIFIYISKYSDPYTV